MNEIQKQRQQRYRQERRAAGLCLWKGCKNEIKDKVYCDVHSAKHREYAAKKRLEKREAGLCAWSGCHNKTANSICEYHLEAHRKQGRENRTKERIKRKELGLCAWSACKNQSNGYCFCDHHRAQHQLSNRNNAGMTKKEVEIMAEFQNFKCAICKQEKPLCGDHDHQSGEPRGLLCNTCNGGLGFFEDNPSYLIAAAEYLNYHKIN
jgi:hypothetical protein